MKPLHVLLFNLIQKCHVLRLEQTTEVLDGSHVTAELVLDAWVLDLDGNATSRRAESRTMHLEKKKDKQVKCNWVGRYAVASLEGHGLRAHEIPTTPPLWSPHLSNTCTADRLVLPLAKHLLQGSSQRLGSDSLGFFGRDFWGHIVLLKE